MAATDAGIYEAFGPDTEASCVLFMQAKKAQQELSFGRNQIAYYMKEYKNE